MRDNIRSSETIGPYVFTELADLNVAYKFIVTAQRSLAVYEHKAVYLSGTRFKKLNYNSLIFIRSIKVPS